MIFTLGWLASCKKGGNPTDPDVAALVDSLKVGLIAYYPFNNSGMDVSGNGNHGTIYNITSVSDRFNRINSAYHFDGYSSYIFVADNKALRLNNTSFTLNAWVKMDAYNQSYGSIIFSKHLSGVDNGWSWSITGYSYGTLGRLFYGPGGGSVNATGTVALGFAQWHMITSVYDVSLKQLSIYTDGVLNNRTSNVANPNASITSDLYIGRDTPGLPTNGYFLQGALDDLSIYSRALTDSQVKVLFASTDGTSSK